MTPLEQAWEFYHGEILTVETFAGWRKAKCPIHEDKHASAQVNLDDGKWRCFAGCGHGDVHDLVKITEKLDSFPEQKRFVQANFGGSDAPYTPEWPAKGKKKGKGWTPAWLR